MKNLRKGFLFFFFIAVLFSQLQAESQDRQVEQIYKDYAESRALFESEREALRSIRKKLGFIGM
jgi:hypothetical protein